MKPKIDFYLLKQTGHQAKDRLLATLCEKALAHGQHVFIYVNDSTEAQRLDTFLWTYKDISFLSHTRESKLAHDVPITLGTKTPLTDKRDILICLHDDIPGYYAEFQRVMHIVTADEGQRECSRAQYRQYQQDGCQPNIHQMRY